MSKVTRRQINLLADYLEGPHPTHNNIDEQTGEITREWNLKCPFHGDQRRSASLNIDKGLFWCAICGGMPVSALIRRKEEWQETRGNGNTPNINGKAPDKKQRTLSEGLIGGWHSALLSDEGALRWLKDRRGLSQQTIERFEIGFENGKLYTIPIRSPEREIWNVRFYNPHPAEGRRKIWSESGYGSPPRLYPISVLIDSDPPEITLCGGEWDGLLALQFGYETVTRTAGEDYWLAEWGQMFKDRVVYLAHDCDAKGQKANTVVGRALRHIADVRIIKFPYEIVEKHGKDLTDFLLEHDPAEFAQLQSDAPPFTKRKQQDTVETVTVLDTADAARVGKPVRVIATVKGRKEPGYTIPHKVSLACTQDAGNKCAICPLRAANGSTKIEVAPDDPLVLNMVQYPTLEMNQAIGTAYGIPGGKCIKLTQEVEEYQSVEVLYARPAIDFVDGSNTDPDAEQYKTLRITSVGKHDTPPNNTVSVLGALYPNPKSQSNEFLAHQVETLKTSIDRFELNGKTIALMERFQGQQPLRKIAEISKALSEHVTRIQGRPEMHALMDLTFHSVLNFNFAGEELQRGWMESLIVGDTGTGKSTAARKLVQHYGAGEIISCEAATFAGVVGGLQQLGGREWVVTWGAVPINDGRLVVLDEISGLTLEEIAEMSDIRSSGLAKLTKIQQEMTWARTRLLWMGNPRNATMANFTYGVDAIRPLIGNAEDIARFDLAMAASKYDVAPEVINQRYIGGELVYTDEACHTLLMWVWTRQAHHVRFTPDAEARVFDAANEIGKLYVEDPPLIMAASVRIKLARVAVAMAARTFSTDETRENVIILPAHVEAAKQFINLLYGMQVFGYRERSKEQLSDRLIAEQNKERMAQYLKGRPLLAKFLRTTGKFRRQDLDEIMSQSKEESNGIISTLYEARMVRKVLGDIVVEPTLHDLLRRVK